MSLASGAYGLAHWFETVSLALCAYGLVSLVFFLSHVKGKRLSNNSLALSAYVLLVQVV